MERRFLGMEQVHIPCNLASILKVIILEVKKKKNQQWVETNTMLHHKYAECLYPPKQRSYQWWKNSSNGDQCGKLNITVQH